MPVAQWIVKHLPTMAAGAVALVRNDERQPLVVPWNSIRFGLRDLLLAMVPAAMAAWIVSQVAAVNLLMLWPDAFYASLWLAVIAVLAWQVFVSRWKWLLTVMLGLAALRAAFVDAGLRNWLFAGDVLGIPKAFVLARFVGSTTLQMQMILLYLMTAVCIVTGLAVLAVFRSQQRRTALRVISGALLLIPMIVLTYLYWQMLGGIEIPATPQLTQNAFPQVLSSAQRLKIADRRQVASIHEQMLVILNRPGHVEVDWSQVGEDTYYAYSPDGTHYRNLARSLQAAAKLLHATGKNDEAAMYDLAILKLGAMHLRGGLVIHAADRDCRGRDWDEPHCQTSIRLFAGSAPSESSRSLPALSGSASRPR